MTKAPQSSPMDRARQRRYRLAHPDKIRARQKQWLAANPNYAKKWRAEHRKEIAGYVCKAKALRPWIWCVYANRYLSKRRGVKFTLTIKQAAELWTGRCAATGLEFRYDGQRGPFAVSLDRIVPRYGYTQKNCRFVLLGYNMLKGIGTDADAQHIAAALLRSST